MGVWSDVHTYFVPNQQGIINRNCRYDYIDTLKIQNTYTVLNIELNNTYVDLQNIACMKQASIG